MSDIILPFPLLSLPSPSSRLFSLFALTHPHVPASLKGTSQPRLMHLGPHLLYGASEAKMNTIPFTHTHRRYTPTHTHGHTTPAPGMTQHTPIETHALIVIEVKEKKQRADFCLVRERGLFPPILLLHILRWNCLTAHRRQEPG